MIIVNILYNMYINKSIRNFFAGELSLNRKCGGGKLGKLQNFCQGNVWQTGITSKKNNTFEYGEAYMYHSII